MDKTQELAPKPEVIRVNINEDFGLFNHAVVENGMLSESVEVNGAGTLTGHVSPQAEDVHGPDNLAAVFDLDTGYRESVVSDESGADQTRITLGPNYVLYATLADGTTRASLGQKSFHGEGDKFAPKVEMYSFDSWIETSPATENVDKFKSRAKAAKRIGQPLSIKGDPKAARFKLSK